MFQAPAPCNHLPETGAENPAPKLTKRAIERDAPFRCNPFLAELTVSVKKRKTRLLDHQVVEDETGARGHEFCEVAYVDKAEFVKVMTKAFRACFDLGAAGSKVFWLVMGELSDSQEQDLIFLNYRQPFRIEGQEVRMAKSSFYDGLKELHAAGFIAPSRQGPGFYWINPDRFFNGNRATFVRELRLKERGLEGPQPKIIYPRQTQSGLL